MALQAFIKNLMDNKLKLGNSTKIIRFEDEELGSLNGKLNKKDFSILNKATIGSCKNHAINYTMDQKFFHRSDIPENISKIKEQVLMDIDPDLCNVRKERWNSNSRISSNVKEKMDDNRNLDLQLKKVRAGFNDFRAVPQKEKMVELGTDSRNNNYGWNISRAVKRTDFSKTLTIDDDRAFSRVRTKNDMLLYEKDYRNPVQKQVELFNNLKVVKSSEAGRRATIRDKIRHIYPMATKENVDAIVRKTLTQNKFQDTLLTCDPNHTLSGNRPDMTKTHISHSFKRYHHSGSWELSKIDNKYSWSCCMNSFEFSPGCVSLHVNPDRWNLISIN